MQFQSNKNTEINQHIATLSSTKWYKIIPTFGLLFHVFCKEGSYLSYSLYLV